MRVLLKLLIIFILLIAPAYAHNILVLPSDLIQEKENYYGFNEVSEIIAQDIINNFNSTPNSKIKSFDLYIVRTKLSNDQQVKNALSKYKNNEIDYKAFKSIANNYGCNYILLINSSVITNKNSLRRNIWEILELSTAFDITYPFRLETQTVLLDAENELVMWSNNYSTKLGTNNNHFSAKTFAQAYDEYEKIKLYSKTIVAPSVTQNITLRFFPKSIRPLQTEIKNSTGGALKFDRTIPEKPSLKPKQDFYGEDWFGI